MTIYLLIYVHDVRDEALATFEMVRGRASNLLPKLLVYRRLPSPIKTGRPDSGADSEIGARKDRAD